MKTMDTTWIEVVSFYTKTMETAWLEIISFCTKKTEIIPLERVSFYTKTIGTVWIELISFSAKTAETIYAWNEHAYSTSRIFAAPRKLIIVDRRYAVVIIQKTSRIRYSLAGLKVKQGFW